MSSERHRLWRRKMRLPAPEKDCVVCGDAFAPLGRAITCSPECSAERERQRNAKFRDNHREELRARGLRDYYANRERALATQAAYREANREKIAEKQRMKRAR
jgi:predicted nucleic acid-binding Zn ribbon protein